jgi:hypothetical protein
MNDKASQDQVGINLAWPWLLILEDDGKVKGHALVLSGTGGIGWKVQKMNHHPRWFRVILVGARSVARIIVMLVRWLKAQTMCSFVTFVSNAVREYS